MEIMFGGKSKTTVDRIRDNRRDDLQTLSRSPMLRESERLNQNGVGTTRTDLSNHD